MGSQLQGSKDCMSVYYENNRSELVKDASTCTAVPKNPWDCRCYSVSGFFLTNRQTFGETRQGWPIFWTNWGRGNLQGNTMGIFLRGFKAFKAPSSYYTRLSDCVDQWRERGEIYVGIRGEFCWGVFKAPLHLKQWPTEEGGKNLHGNRRWILLTGFQGPT